MPVILKASGAVCGMKISDSPDTIAGAEVCVEHAGPIRTPDPVRPNARGKQVVQLLDICCGLLQYPARAR